MRKIVGLFRFASTYVRLVRDTDRLDLVFALADSFDESPGLRRMLARPEVKAYLARPLPPLTLKLEELRALPEGSLGREFARFLDQRKLDPTGVYHSAVDTSGDAALMKLHLERSHDLWHTVLGFDTDVAGELGLQAFYIAHAVAARAPAAVGGAAQRDAVPARGRRPAHGGDHPRLAPRQDDAAAVRGGLGGDADLADRAGARALRDHAGARAHGGDGGLSHERWAEAGSVRPGLTGRGGAGQIAQR
ncbi:Coq4 family protein [Nannocystis pusilla]|uniref:Coq4 family protein n=1 Tax=Nannocystis pusilla TaxID=889268 RepID=A0A9X3EJ22_9BACT|nr:Coq4 family protein [Nannocystis pusilla]MCY1004110.1 Coq4 family protein [Nannocystis pusilla]